TLSSPTRVTCANCSEGVQFRIKASTKPLVHEGPSRWLNIRHPPANSAWYRWLTATAWQCAQIQPAARSRRPKRYIFAFNTVRIGNLQGERVGPFRTSCGVPAPNLAASG